MLKVTGQTLSLHRFPFGETCLALGVCGLSFSLHPSLHSDIVLSHDMYSINAYFIQLWGIQIVLYIYYS